MKLHINEVLMFFVTTKISWYQNSKTASSRSSVTTNHFFSFCPIETDDDESEDYSIPDGQMQKLVL